MIGARVFTFPRINLLSWYLYIIGGLMMVHCMVTGGVDTGWTFYVPFSTAFSNTKVIEAGLAIFVAGFSSILTGLQSFVTIHRMRAPGMTWSRLPVHLGALHHQHHPGSGNTRHRDYSSCWRHHQTRLITWHLQPISAAIRFCFSASLVIP